MSVFALRLVIAVVVVCCCHTVAGQGEAATPVQDYFPVGVVSSPAVTESPDSFVGTPSPSPPEVTYPATPSPPLSGVVSNLRLRNRIDITCSFFNEGRIAEYLELLTHIMLPWLLQPSSNHSEHLNTKLTGLRLTSGAALPLSELYGDGAKVSNRLVPLRSLSFSRGGGMPSLYSGPQVRQSIAMDYGTYVVVSLVLLPLTNVSSQLVPSLPVDDSTTVHYAYPFRGDDNNNDGNEVLKTAKTSTAPSEETDILCEAFAASFIEKILSRERDVLTSVSSPSAWLLSGIHHVRCPVMAPRIPLGAAVGINYLWVVFIIMGVCCVSGAAFALFWRTRSDQDVDIYADEKEQIAAAERQGLKPPGTTDRGKADPHGQLFSDTNDGDDLASRIDSKTESIHEIRSERHSILDSRKKKRIRELVAMALTGDSTIYGASDEEREMVAMILKNPRFDGGRLTQESDASPVEVVLNNDRLFLLPPSDIKLSYKVQGRKGRVTSVSFPVSVEGDGSIGTSASCGGGGDGGAGGRTLRMDDVISAGSLGAQLAALHDSNNDEPDEAPLVASVPRRDGGGSTSASEDVREEVVEDESTRINRLITEAALRNLQRREGQMPNEAPSKIKERLQRILDAEADDEWL